MRQVSVNLKKNLTNNFRKNFSASLALLGSVSGKEEGPIDIRANSDHKLKAFVDTLLTQIYKADQFYIQKENELINEFLKLQIEMSERAYHNEHLQEEIEEDPFNP